MSVCPKCQELQPDERLNCSECGAQLLYKPKAKRRPHGPDWQFERTGLAHMGVCVDCGAPLVSVTGEILDMHCARCYGWEKDGRIDHAAWVAARRGAA